MSGRFDGSQSTIGNTRKYTPAHDCHKRLLENALCFGKSSDGRSPGWLSASPSALDRRLRSIRCHAAVATVARSVATQPCA